MAVRDPLVADRQGDPLTASLAPQRTRPGAHRAKEPETADPARLEALLGYRFTRPALLREALTHRSAAARRGQGSNERLEFMGDRVLGLIVAEWLVERFPDEQEGALGKRLAHLVSQPVLADVAECIGLADVLAVSPGEARAGVTTRATVRADALEAAIGALFLDGGLGAARDFVRRAWAEAIEAQARPPQDAKTSLQEWAQKRGLPLPDYSESERIGPPHAPCFTVTARVGTHSASGRAGTKRAAEQLAAAALLARLAAPGASA